MSGDPLADRPFMPGYGVLPEHEGSGLMPWAEAQRRLTVAHDYWVATARPDGAPHVMPVWGVWWLGALWFSSALSSRKARNLAADQRCTVTTDDALNPVVLDGVAERVVDLDRIAGFVAAVNEKYDSDISVDFQDPAVNGTFAVRLRRAIGMSHGDFTGSPTRWRFPDS